MQACMLPAARNRAVVYTAAYPRAVPAHPSLFVVKQLFLISITKRKIIVNK